MTKRWIIIGAAIIAGLVGLTSCMQMKVANDAAEDAVMDAAPVMEQRALPEPLHAPAAKQLTKPADCTGDGIGGTGCPNM